ncbi:hypothetical protein ACA910_021994 [Epithemia clementina (nom. ined.)]
MDFSSDVNQHQEPAVKDAPFSATTGNVASTAAISTYGPEKGATAGDPTAAPPTTAAQLVAVESTTAPSTAAPIAVAGAGGTADKAVTVAVTSQANSTTSGDNNLKTNTATVEAAAAPPKTATLDATGGVLAEAASPAQKQPPLSSHVSTGRTPLRMVKKKRVAAKSLLADCSPRAKFRKSNDSAPIATGTMQTSAASTTTGGIRRKKELTARSKSRDRGSTATAKKREPASPARRASKSPAKPPSRATPTKRSTPTSTSGSSKKAPSSSGKTKSTGSNSAKMIYEGKPTKPLGGGVGDWPKGWTERQFSRESGATKGRADYYWFPPKEHGEYRLRSIAEVKRYIEVWNKSKSGELAFASRKG